MSGLVVLDEERLREIMREEIDRTSPANDNAQKKWLTAKEIAGLLGVSTRTLPTLVKREGLPAHRVSERKVVYSRAEVDAWLESRIAAPGARRDRHRESSRRLRGEG